MRVELGLYFIILLSKCNAMEALLHWSKTVVIIIKACAVKVAVRKFFMSIKDTHCLFFYWSVAVFLQK